MAIQLNFDRTTPQGAQAAQAMDIFYGPGGLNGYVGAVDDKTMVATMGGGDELLASAIASAKQNDAKLADQAPIKTVASQLPPKRAGVFYVAVDNIIATGMAVAAQQGMAMPFKLPPDLPPLGFSAGTEGSALRIDMHISADLISSLMAAGMQMRQMMGGGPPPGAL
jgi:hypothetical protein